MPEEDELAPAQFAAQSSATPVLPAAGRLLWGEEAAGAGWGLLLEEGGMTISHVGGWLRAWMFGQRCAPRLHKSPPLILNLLACVSASSLRLLPDGGVVMADNEGGWTGLSITPDVAQLVAEQGFTFLRYGGAPCVAAGWSVGVVGRGESTTALPSVSGMLVFSHASGARVALREYDHAFFCSSGDGGPTAASSSEGAPPATGMLWSVPSAAGDGGADDDMEGGAAAADGVPSSAQFETVAQQAKIVLPPGAYSWPGPPSVPDTWSVMSYDDEAGAGVRQCAQKRRGVLFADAKRMYRYRRYHADVCGRGRGRPGAGAAAAHACVISVGFCEVIWHSIHSVPFRSVCKRRRADR